jgi:hypothetical protein
VWHNLPAFCPKCGFKFRSGVVGEQFAQLVVVQRQPTSSAVGKCPRCGTQGQLEPWADEAIRAVTSPERSADQRSTLKSILDEDAATEGVAEEKIEKRAPAFYRLRRLIPKERSDRIALAGLLVALASLTNDIYANVTDDALTAGELERVLRDHDRRHPPPSSPRRIERSDIQLIDVYTMVSLPSGPGNWYECPPPPGPNRDAIENLIDGQPDTTWSAELERRNDSELEQLRRNWDRIRIVVFVRPTALAKIEMTFVSTFNAGVWASMSRKPTPLPPNPSYGYNWGQLLAMQRRQGRDIKASLSISNSADYGPLRQVEFTISCPMDLSSQRWKMELSELVFEEF